VVDVQELQAVGGLGSKRKPLDEELPVHCQPRGVQAHHPNPLIPAVQVEVPDSHGLVVACTRHVLLIPVIDPPPVGPHPVR
jgi:hypothetical protein